MTARGFLTYIAIADAHGMAYEFVDDISAVGPDDLSYKPNPRRPENGAARYSDDTQMSLANAELLLQYKPSRLRAPWRLADAWVNAYQRDKRPGYSSRMQTLLEESRNGRCFLEVIAPWHGTTSGAAMRAGVFGLLPRLSDALEVAERQARLTHDTPTGIVAAKVAAAAVHAMHYGRCDKAWLPEFLDATVGPDWRTIDDHGNPYNGLYIVRRALTAVLQSTTLTGLLHNCVAYGPRQDIDTISAIAMAVAARAEEIEDDLPATMFTRLENGPFGHDYLAGIDRQLLDRFPTPTRARPLTAPSPN